MDNNENFHQRYGELMDADAKEEDENQIEDERGVNENEYGEFMDADAREEENHMIKDAREVETIENQRDDRTDFQKILDAEIVGLNVVLDSLRNQLKTKNFIIIITIILFSLSTFYLKSDLIKNYSLFNKEVLIEEENFCAVYARGLFNEQLSPTGIGNGIKLSNKNEFFDFIPNRNGISFKEYKGNFAKYHKDNDTIYLDGNYFDKCSIFRLSKCDLTQGIDVFQRIFMDDGPCFRIHTCDNSFLKSNNNKDNYLTTTNDPNDPSTRFVINCYTKDIILLKKDSNGIPDGVKIVKKENKTVVDKTTGENKLPQILFDLNEDALVKLSLFSLLNPEKTCDIKNKIVNKEGFCNITQNK